MWRLKAVLYVKDLVVGRWGLWAGLFCFIGGRLWPLRGEAGCRGQRWEVIRGEELVHTVLVSNVRTHIILGGKVNRV